MAGGAGSVGRKQTEAWGLGGGPARPSRVKSGPTGQARARRQSLLSAQHTTGTDDTRAGVLMNAR